MMPDGHHPGFIESFGCACRGIIETIQSERNIKVMLAVGLCAVIAGVILRLDALSWAIIVVLIAVVLTCELLNTALEHVVDLASPTWHDLAKRAKDVAAAAVLIASIGAAIAGLIVYIRAALALFG